ncbi:hypothetical protein K7X08_018044 [Anisodus acutangulus]|uniref:Uncharacterized protein n=1 Tax=Anisodus acutangulus TaxID=402998 RepID=A0A9Q1RA38_9SOLA|nr:hypothetical protein K7X08_018044 [Anisodus acutangulus]
MNPQKIVEGCFFDDFITKVITLCILLIDIPKRSHPEMETITTSENSNTHAYTRLDFLNRSCTPGLAINSIGIKVEGLEKGMNLYRLQKERKLRTKFKDFKRHTNAEREKENEVALSKIAMIEKELETKEVRMYSQAIRALKQIQVEDKEPKGKGERVDNNYAKAHRGKKL